MEDFAMYILNEKDYIQKMIIAYYMSTKTGIYFDKSVVLRAEIARMFMNYASLDVDQNEVITAMLLCNCKKVNNMQRLERIKSYAKEGAEYLASLGFDKDFCDICEGLNRYSKQKTRKKESDILELVDQFTGLILRREDRDAFSNEEALIILKERNLKNVQNRYLQDFIIFVNAMENIHIRDNVDVPVIRKLAYLAEREKTVKSLIAKMGNRYSKEIDRLMKTEIKRETEQLLYSKLKTDTREENNIENKEIIAEVQTSTSKATETMMDIGKEAYSIDKVTETKRSPKEFRESIKNTKQAEESIQRGADISKSLESVQKNNGINKVVETMQDTKKKLQTAHRYTRKIRKINNPNRALFSQEVAERVMNHDFSFKFD